MFDTIRLSKYVGSSWVADVDLEEIAETLGLNYDSGTSVLYAGDNPDNGILVTVTSIRITFKLWVNGVEVTGSNAFEHSALLSSQNSVLNYKKSDNGVAFGVSGTAGVPYLKIIVSTGHTVDGVNKIGYVCSNYNSSHIHSLLEDGNYEIYMPVNQTAYSDTLISAAPFFNIIENFTFDHVYIGVCFNNSVIAQHITIDDKEYVVLSKSQNSSPPFIFEL